MPNSNIVQVITLKVFEILTSKAGIKQKLSFYYRPKFNLGTKWNQENTGHVYRTHSSLALVLNTLRLRFWNLNLIWEVIGKCGVVAVRHTLKLTSNNKSNRVRSRVCLTAATPHFPITSQIKVKFQNLNTNAFGTHSYNWL